MLKSLGFRIWLPFSLALLTVFCVLSIYNTSQQEEIFLKNRKSEVRKLSQTLSKQIKKGIEEEDFESITKSLEITKSAFGFEVIHLELGDLNIKYPANSKMKYDVSNTNFIEDDFEFSSSLGKAKLHFISSTKLLNTSIQENNWSVFFIFLVVFIVSSAIFFWLTLRISKPFRELVQLANKIKNQEYSHNELDLPDTSEIQIIHKSLLSLNDSLRSREEYKDNLLKELKKQVEIQTQELNQLSMVAMNTTNGVIITNKEKEIIWVNKSFEKITGYASEEILGKTPKVFQFEKTDPIVVERMNQQIAEKQIVNEEILNIGKNGREYWLAINIVPILDQNNDISGYIAVETDITEKRKSETKLIKSEETLRQILNSSSELIHSMDIEGNILWANTSWLQKMNVKLDEIIGKSLMNFLDEVTLQEFKDVIPKVSAGLPVENLDCVFISSSGKEIKLKGKSIPVFEDGQVVGSQAYLHDVTDIIAAQKEILEMSKLQKLAIDVSNRFINLPIEQYNEAVISSLKELSNFIDAKRGYVVEYNLKEGNCAFTHEWVASGINSKKDVLGKIDLSNMQYKFAKHQKGEIVLIQDFSELPDASFGKLMYSEGLKTIITLPIYDEENLVGFIGFDIFDQQRNFTNEEIEILKLFAQMLLNIDKRMKFIDDLNKSKLNIQKMNDTLERKVIDNTKKNLDLSRTLVEQEKLATIGEISAGIAHDLNTPLGTIRVGADNVRYMIDRIFEKDLASLSHDNLTFILKHAPHRKVENFIGGLQLRKDRIEMHAFLKEKYSDYDEKLLLEITELLVKARVNTNDEELINQTFESNNPLLFADTFYQIYQACNQLETIKKSSDKAVKVVQDVRSFIKGEGLQNEKRRFNLKENIDTVLGVFRYELAQDVEIKNEIDDDFEMEGYDVKLFQLWSNLIKNSLEAMEDQENKYIGIFCACTPENTVIIFENNGPKIPDEVRENMFKKFYTTKAKKSGSGLGLSIVKNILTDHNASIEVESDDKITRFRITF
jgi:PAS domain S-box-containing protein